MSHGALKNLNVSSGLFWISPGLRANRKEPSYFLFADHTEVGLL
jgi:hypothetical protein